MSAPSIRASAPAATPVSATVVDWAFFVLGGIATGWFAALLLDASLEPRHIWFLIVFWAVLAYLVLPRVHRILTRIYIPDYFMGRARTSDGLFGDPINLAFLGRPEQVRGAMERAGWTAADPITLASSRRIITASLLHRSYPGAPVSPLFLFGRQQDFAYQQEIDGDPRRRHHLRFWRCPEGWLLPGGIAVDWLAAAAYDRSVGVSFFTLQVTHRIASDIDDERDFVVSSLTASTGDLSVRVLKDFSTGYHSRNGGGDSVETDGDLPVVDASRVPLPPGTSPGAPSTVPADRPQHLPAPTLVGAVMVFLRAMAALAAGLALLAGGDNGWSTFLPGQGSADQSGAGTTGVLLLLFAGIDAVMGVLILPGGNRSRLTAMSLSAVVILAQIGAAVSAGPVFRLPADPVGFSLDILIILALSSERSRDFAHRRRQHSVRSGAGAKQSR